MHSHLEMPDHGRRDPPFVEFTRSQPGGQPGTWIEEPDFHLMLPGQVPIHISNGVASFGRRAQVTFNVVANRIRGLGCGDPVVLHMSDKGIHDLILAFMGASGKCLGHPLPATTGLGQGPISATDIRDATPPRRWRPDA